MLMLEEIVEGLRAQGFRKQVLTIGHSGSLWLGAFVKHINRRLEDIVLVDAHRGAGPVCPRVPAHAREVASRIGDGQQIGALLGRLEEREAVPLFVFDAFSATPSRRSEHWRGAHARSSSACERGAASTAILASATRRSTSDAPVATDPR
jgi:hypothetical protein